MIWHGLRLSLCSSEEEVSRDSAEKNAGFEAMHTEAGVWLLNLACLCPDRLQVRSEKLVAILALAERHGSTCR